MEGKILYLKGGSVLIVFGFFLRNNDTVMKKYIFIIYNYFCSMVFMANTRAGLSTKDPGFDIFRSYFIRGNDSKSQLNPWDISFDGKYMRKL